MKTYSLEQLHRAVPAPRRVGAVYLPPSGRPMGIRCAATKGTGKSRLFGRVIVAGDFLQGIPTVVIDPIGGLIKEFMGKLATCDREIQRALWPRVRYIDMAGSVAEDIEEKRVMPFPLYAKEGDETHYQVSQRYIDVIARTDPSLSSAPIQGMNAFRRVAEDLGMLLSAAELQITEAESILRNPRSYESYFRSLTASSEELSGAADFIFSDLPKLRPNDWQMQTSAYLRKISEFQRDPVMKAMFGASYEGINWQGMIDHKETILFDFSRVEGKERIQFLMLWVYWSLIRFIKRRGEGKHHQPISLVIDEITFLLGDPDARHELLADDLVELTDRISRSHNIWVTIIHQELNQVSKRVAETFMRMGTQIFGSTADPDAALQVARRFYPYQPLRVKATDTVWGSHQGSHYGIDERRSYLSIQEQQEMNSRQVLEQEPFCFLIGISAKEGKVATELRPMTIRHIDTGRYADPTLVAEAKRRLMQRDGRRILEIRDEIARRAIPATDTEPPSGATQRRRLTPIPETP